MASFTQIRLQQLTGSAVDFKTEVGQYITPVAAASLTGSDLQDLLGALGAAVQRIHGRASNEVFEQVEGRFDTTTVDFNTSTFDVDATGAFTVDAIGASNITAGGPLGALTLSGSEGVSVLSHGGNIVATAEQGIVDINATLGNVDIDAGGVTSIDGAGGIDIGKAANVAVDLNGSTVEIDGTGAVTVESSGGALSVGADDVNQPLNLGSGGNRAITVGKTGGTSTVSVFSKGGSLTLDATGQQVDIDSATLDADFTGAFAIDGVGNSNVTAGGSGNLTLSGSGGVTVSHTGTGGLISIRSEQTNVEVAATVGGVQLSGSNGVGLSGSVVFSADGNMSSAGGLQAGKMLFAHHSEFAPFRDADLFSASTTVIGALTALATAAGGGVIGYQLVPATVSANTDVQLNSMSGGEAGFAVAINTTGIEPSNTEVFVNGQLMLSGTSAGGAAVAGGDYIVKSYEAEGRLKFAFDLEPDDVVLVKTTATPQ